MRSPRSWVLTAAAAALAAWGGPDLRAAEGGNDGQGPGAEAPPRGFKDPESKPEAVYNARVIELARGLKVPVGYVFEEIQAAGDRHKYISRDGVHWTQPGKELAGRAWARALDQVRFVLRDRP
jgi:hypothetical protein